jgi:hypothetical protein
MIVANLWDGIIGIPVLNYSMDRVRMTHRDASGSTCRDEHEPHIFLWRLIKCQRA